MNQKKIINEKSVEKFVEKRSITLLYFSSDKSKKNFPGEGVQESDDDKVNGNSDQSDDDVSPYMMNIRWNPSDQSDDDVSPYMVMNIR